MPTERQANEIAPALLFTLQLMHEAGYTKEQVLRIVARSWAVVEQPNPHPER